MNVSKEVGYSIEKTLSEQGNCLIIRLIEVQRDGLNIRITPNHTPINQALWQKLSNPKDKEPLKIITLKDCNINNDLLKISYPQTIAVLKLLATSGKVFFENKQLACDFFTKVDFYYKVDQENVSGVLKTSKDEYDLTSCDFICKGNPCWFIKGHSLKLVQTDVSFKDLKTLYLNPQNYSLNDLVVETDENAPRIVYIGNSFEEKKKAQDPLPLLILNDRTGAFANLLMNYGTDKIYDFNDVVSLKKRNIPSEKAWEKDLLETGFVKKNVGKTDYFCPLSDVNKSILFLLEIGWNIQDFKDKRVFALSKMDYQCQVTDESIKIKGTFKFSDYEATLNDVAGAFNRKERFVEMDQAVGLLPEKWDDIDLKNIFEEGEISSTGLTFKKNHIGMLDKLLERPQKNTFENALNQLKTGLYQVNDLEDTVLPSSFKGSLRPYQQQGLNWLKFLNTYGFNGILADDMGLGKTVQIIAFISQMKTSKPILIVMPTSLIFNWKNEFEKFLPDKKVVLFHGPLRHAQSINENDSVILTSYATMRLDALQLIKQQFSVIILDEAQNIKNADSQTAKTAFLLESSFKLLLTGTPLENHLNEIWSHFNFLMPDLLGNRKMFESDLQASLSDPRYLQKIKRKIRPFILRRKKKEVAKDLPECVEQVVYIEMSNIQRQIYDSFLAGIKNQFFTKITANGTKKNKLEVFEAILRLRQICCHPLLISSLLPEAQDFESAKLDALLQDLETAVEENDKAIVYSQFTSMLQIIAKELKKKNIKFVTLDGSTKSREQVVDQFQNDPETHIFLISLKAGGTGLNLTAADHIIIYDPWWNESVENQAITRAHRIGRTSTVFAKRYIMIESIEEKMMKLKEKKKELSDHIFDDDTLAFSSFTDEEIDYLLS